MIGNHVYVTYDSVPYGAVPWLPEPDIVDPSAVVRGVRAEEILAETPDDRVLAVAPESLATAYRLGGEPLTVLELAELPATARRTLADSVEGDSTGYEYLAWGSAPERQNHVLGEFA